MRVSQTKLVVSLYRGIAYYKDHYSPAASRGAPVTAELGICRQKPTIITVYDYIVDIYRLCLQVYRAIHSSLAVWLLRSIPIL